MSEQRAQSEHERIRIAAWWKARDERVAQESGPNNEQSEPVPPK